MQSSSGQESFEQIHGVLAEAASRPERSHDTPKLIDSYAEYVLLSEQDEEIFEQFCELKGLDLLRSLYRLYPEEVLNTVSLLLTNLNRPACLSYMLSHPFLCELISDSNTTHLEYYIAMLKTLARRLDSQKIAMLYNQRHCRFPLAWEAARFYNHPECMVRASTAVIILGLMRIGEPIEYFASFPFSVYYLNLACSLYAKCRQVQQLLSNGCTDRLHELVGDQRDIALLLVDIMELNQQHINRVVANSVIVYVLMPLLRSIATTGKGEFSINLSLYLLLEYANLFKANSDISEFLCLALFGLDLSRDILALLEKPQPLPSVFNSSYCHDSLLDKYPEEVDHYCRLVLGVPDRPGFTCNREFQEAVGEAGAAIGLDLPSRQRLPEFWLYNYHEGRSAEPNPIRSTLLSFLKTKDDRLLQLITKLILLQSSNKNLHCSVLLKCGLLLPAIHPTKFLQPQNLGSLDQLANTYLTLALSQLPFSTDTLNAVYWLLDELMEKQAADCPAPEAALILKAFERSSGQLRKIVKSRMGPLLAAEMEETFEYPLKELKETLPGVLTSEYDFAEEEYLKQQLISFNCLRKLRYRYVPGSRFPPTHNDLELRYIQKFETASEQWHVGSNQLIENRSMTSCYSQTLKQPAILLRDHLRFVLARETGQENELQVLLNLKLKCVQIRELGDTGLQVSTRGRPIAELQFESEYLASNTAEKYRLLKEAAVQEQLSFLNGYLAECLSDCQPS